MTVHQQISLFLVQIYLSKIVPLRLHNLTPIHTSPGWYYLFPRMKSILKVCMLWSSEEMKMIMIAALEEIAGKGLQQNLQK
jgi:hypothetical protein